MYKLYTRWQDGGWDGPSCYDNLEDIQKIISNSKCSYMIIKNDGNGDEVIECKNIDISFKTKREEFKSKYKVKTNKISKAKKKEESRKLTEKYIDK